MIKSFKRFLWWIISLKNAGFSVAAGNHAEETATVADGCQPWTGLHTRS